MDRNYVIVNNERKGIGGSLLFWGVYTQDNEKRSFGGYTSNLNGCEKYTREEALGRPGYDFFEYTSGCDWRKFEDFIIRIDQLEELGYRPMLIYYR